MKKTLEYLKTRKAYEIIFLVLTFAGFLAWITGLVINGVDGKQIELFIGRCNNFFADITNPMGYAAHRNVYNETYYFGGSERAYPPISYVIAYCFSRIIDMQPYFDANFFWDLYKDPQILIILIIAIIINMLIIYEIVRSYKEGNNAVKIATALAVCVSMPVLFTIERANLLLLTIVFVFFYIFNYDSENRIRKELALMSLAIAASFKLTPAVLGILLLYNKQWKEAVRVIIYGVIFGILPFLFFEGGFSNIAQMFKNASMNLASYSSAEGTTLVAVLVSFGAEATEHMMKVVQNITYVIGAILLFEAFFFNKKWETILAVTMVLIIVPSHSGYYCIIYILPALIAFLNAKEHSYWDLLILMAMFFIVNDFQSYLTQNVLSYHISIVIILLVLLVRGTKNVITRISSKKTQDIKYT